MVEKKVRCTAVVLAAGTGSRMKANVAKQFLELAGRPLIYYSLKAVEDSRIIDDCILVTGEEDITYMQQNVVARYGLRKVKAVIAGGSERCFSVANAMRWLKAEGMPEGYVFIHDGARPLLSEEILERAYEAVAEFGACVAAMPSKDTVKMVDEEGFAAFTPERKKVWIIQTPQVFEKELIVGAYESFEYDVKERTDGQERQSTSGAQRALVTDDASVVERYTDRRVKLVEGDYTNIKVTTPEDLVLAEALLGAKNYASNI